MRVGVLASGTGTNLQALIDAQARGELGPARIVVVGVNVAACGALARAEKAGIPTFVRSHAAFASRGEFDEALIEALKEYAVDCLALAGFMRVLGPSVLGAFKQGVINMHPALLPAFPGVHAQRQAFAYGVKLAGCTVHFVDEGVDTGPIIAQTAVPRLDDDSEESLRARILAEEHRLYPAVVRALAEGRVARDGRQVRVTPLSAPPLPTSRLTSFEG